jgi:hypothetical protein
MRGTGSRKAGDCEEPEATWQSPDYQRDGCWVIASLLLAISTIVWLASS